MPNVCLQGECRVLSVTQLASSKPARDEGPGMCSLGSLGASLAARHAAIQRARRLVGELLGEFGVCGLGPDLAVDA